MKTVYIYKADPITKNEPVEGVRIDIVDDIPHITGDESMTLEKCAYFYEIQSQRLFDALVSALPQGIIEPLIIKFMQHRVSLYRGTMEQPERKADEQ